MSQLKTLVVGASVAGPMAAYWLAKAGARVTVIERFPRLRTNGQAIDIRTTGITVMRKIPGMEAAVRAKTTPIEGMSFVRENGRRYGTIRATGNPEQQSLLSEYEIFRGDLAQILLNWTYSAVGGRFIAIKSDPGGGSRITLMGVHPRDKRDLTLPFREAVKQGEQALKRFVAQHYKGVGWKTEEAMEAMMGSSDFYASEMVQVKVPSLYKGRFTLVGDAGYAPGPTGTGTTLAMTGAYVLAGEIGKHKGDLAAGLKGYEERMRPITNDMQKIPPFVPGIAAPQTAWGIWLRNSIFAFVAWTNILEYAQRFSEAPLPALMSTAFRIMNGSLEDLETSIKVVLSIPKGSPKPDAPGAVFLTPGLFKGPASPTLGPTLQGYTLWWLPLLPTLELALGKAIIRYGWI